MALFRRRAAVGRPGEWFYCLRHRTVEEGPECRGVDRLGPYATRAEAEHALETVAERNAEWDEGEPRGGARRDDSPGDT
jgi:hypothetical protein